jgi:competence protein ComEC
VLGHGRSRGRLPARAAWSGERLRRRGCRRSGTSPDPLAARLREWAHAETAPGRLFPWLPVAFGFGVVLYFTAEREPVWWVALALALFLSGLAFEDRHTAGA